MKKILKRLALIAIAAVLVCTACLGFTACEKEVVISVYVFAGESDQETNTKLVEDWAAAYAEKLKAQDPETYGEDFTIQTKVTFDSDTTAYFTTVRKQLAAGNAPDLFYVSPKYVKSYAKKGTVLDLTDYIDFASYDISQVWNQALGFYAYDSTNGIIGEPVSYNAATGKFENEQGGTAGIYALPKDLSSFGLAYNGNFFTDEKKAEYAKTATQIRSGDTGVVTYLDGTDAPIVSIGKTVVYHPYNFYSYDSYSEALAAGDPVAVASNRVGGYEITMPGYPNDLFEIKAEDQVEAQAYDASIGYTTYTYAEYGAMTWAVCYYANSIERTVNVYGNDQYEGTLYLLPWLAGNDTGYINSDFTKATATDNADGTQTGVNSTKFIETYTAFLAYGSDWNGNSYYCGDGNNLGGWDSFNAGNCVFYGCGTWDMPSLNCADKSALDYQLMPEPVAESFSLRSRIKNMNYESQSYGSTTQSEFTAEEIYENQLDRQYEWAARLDTVGYGVNAKVEKDNLGKDSEWKIAACADLCASLTIEENAQVELTYAGSQLPNYRNQCIEYLFYQSEEYAETGAFKNMITPDGDAQGNDVWDEYYEIANELVAETNKDIVLKDWMAQNHPDKKYNESQANVKVRRLSDRGKAFNALCMVSYNYESRNICLRMNEVNGIKDACMYTYTTDWIDKFSAEKGTFLIAYCQQSVNAWDNFQEGNLDYAGAKYCTPYAYCTYFAGEVQNALDQSILDENEAMGI